MGDGEGRIHIQFRAVDESGVYVLFGTTGVLAFSHDGRERWRTFRGNDTHEYPAGHSSILHDDLVIVNASYEYSVVYDRHDDTNDFLAFLRVERVGMWRRELSYIVVEVLPGRIGEFTRQCRADEYVGADAQIAAVHAVGLFHHFAAEKRLRIDRNHHGIGIPCGHMKRPHRERQLALRVRRVVGQAAVSRQRTRINRRLGRGGQVDHPSGRMLFQDNFNHGTVANYDAITQDASQSGPLASSIDLRASRQLFGTVNNEALLPAYASISNQARIRFHDQTGPGTVGGRHDFTGDFSTAGVTGVRVEWDVNWDLSNDWTAFNFGSIGLTSGEPNVLVNNAATDVGILFKKDQTVQAFDNNNNVLDSTFGYTTTGIGHITIDLLFAGVNEGDALTLNAWVDSTQVASNLGGFTWNNLAAEGGINLELENRTGPNTIDNLTISVIPEPGVFSLFALAGAVLILVRRFKRG